MSSKFLLIPNLFLACHLKSNLQLQSPPLLAPQTQVARQPPQQSRPLAKPVKRLNQLRPISRISMPRPNMKKRREKMHGTSSSTKWIRWTFLTKKRSLLSKRSSTKSQKIIGCRGPRFLSRISSQRRSSVEEPLVRWESAEIGRPMRLSPSRRWRSKRWSTRTRLLMWEPRETSWLWPTIPGSLSSRALSKMKTTYILWWNISKEVIWWLC